MKSLSKTLVLLQVFINKMIFHDKSLKSSQCHSQRLKTNYLTIIIVFSQPTHPQTVRALPQYICRKGNISLTWREKLRHNKKELFFFTVTTTKINLVSRE